MTPSNQKTEKRNIILYYKVQAYLKDQVPPLIPAGMALKIINRIKTYSSGDAQTDLDLIFSVLDILKSYPSDEITHPDYESVSNKILELFESPPEYQYKTLEFDHLSVIGGLSLNQIQMAEILNGIDSEQFPDIHEAISLYLESLDQIEKFKEDYKAHHKTDKLNNS